MQTYWSNEAIKIYLLAHVEQVPGGCWIWKRSLDRRGYGLCRANGLRGRAARVAYRAFVGPIPPGHDVHHTCLCRNCINPAHLEPMAHGRHMRLHSQSGVQSGVWAGVNNGRAKLTENDVRFIRVAENILSAQSLASNLGVSPRTIWHVRSGLHWSHVKLPSFPERPLAEVLQYGQVVIRKSLATLLKVRADCQVLGVMEPPSLGQAITVAQIICGGH